MFWDNKNKCKKYCIGCKFASEFNNNFYCVNELGEYIVATKNQVLVSLGYTALHICRGLLIKKNCPFFEKDRKL